MKSKLQADRIDIILFSLAVAFTVIGVHQVMVSSIAESYWIFMLVFTVLIIYNIRKMRKGDDEDEDDTEAEEQLPRDERRRQARSSGNKSKKRR